jgi:hypothetical protein
VGLPTNEDDNNSSRVFIDVFNDARLLSYSDCAGIVLQYGVALHPSMLTPLTNEQVWQRMAANLIHCHSNHLSLFTFTGDAIFEELLPLFILPEYGPVPVRGVIPLDGGYVWIENFNELVSRVGVLCHHD